MKTLKLDAEIGYATENAWWGRTIGPDAVTDFLADAAPGERVKIEINSPGGLIVPGLAMANSIKNSKAHVVAHVTGIAASMASVVMCACDEIQLEEGSFVMMHNPWSWAEGDADAMRHEAEVLDKMKAAIMAFYRGKFGDKTDEEISGIMDAETWMTGTDALRAGLKCVVIPTTVQAAACATRHHFAHMPEAAARFLAVKDEPPPAEPKGEGVEAPAEATASVQQQDGAPAEGSVIADTIGDQSAEEWQARLAGLQAAKDRELAEMSAKYKGDLAEMKARHEAALEELRAEKDSISNQLDESQKALASAQAEVSSYKAKVEEGEKALAEAREQLDAEIAQHRKLASAALKQPANYDPNKPAPSRWGLRIVPAK